MLGPIVKILIYILYHNINKLVEFYELKNVKSDIDRQ